MTSEQPDQGQDSGRARREPGRRPSPRLVVVMVILVVVLVFGLVNLEDATIDFVFGEVTIPVFFVIAVPALLGFGAGLLLQHHRARQRRS